MTDAQNRSPSPTPGSHPPASPTRGSGEGAVLPENRAKQGGVGLPILIVLVVAIALTCVGFLSVYLTLAHQPRDATHQELVNRANLGTRTNR